MCFRAHQFAAGEWVSLFYTSRPCLSHDPGRAMQYLKKRGEGRQFRTGFSGDRCLGPGMNSQELRWPLEPTPLLQSCKGDAHKHKSDRSRATCWSTSQTELSTWPSLRTSPSGSAPGPGGCTNEFLRVCLDDAEVLQLFFWHQKIWRGAAHHQQPSPS